MSTLFQEFISGFGLVNQAQWELIKLKASRKIQTNHNGVIFK